MVTINRSVKEPNKVRLDKLKIGEFFIDSKGILCLKVNDNPFYKGPANVLSFKEKLDEPAEVIECPFAQYELVTPINVEFSYSVLRGNI